ncbi:MAG: hypothetical protein MK297_09510, partial [Planctomycetes bacterium]|nr:hypothetical protein [Planctomycetota bacterium]
TIRVYANLDEGGRILSVFGDSQSALSISLVDGAFYQNFIGGPTSKEINPAFFPIDPALQWDSYVSIGSIDSNDNNLADIGINWTGFESGGAVITDNGAWFVTPDDTQGVEINGRVFLGQFTIPVGSTFVAVMNVQGKNAAGEVWSYIGADVIYEAYGEPGDTTVYCLAISNSFCPCGNGVAFGDWGGCRNSTGVGGKLLASGSPSLSNDTLVLEASGLVPNLPCLFFSGANRVNGGAGLPFGDGLRCAGFEAVRIQVTGANAAGEAATSVEVSTNGQAYGHTIEVGETVHYQCWYRDDVSVSPCGNSFNTTNGFSLTWNR